ncbi:MAG: insulinase family protein [Cyclobacteriaceae bacterium]
MEEQELITLSNGIRIIHKQIAHTRIAHVGIMLDIGSRDELDDQQGIAHFWEHMAFKGTKKRKAYHIINRLDSLGGELNAYTTREKICFYASLLDNHLEKAVELLADITFNSTFPPAQIEKERMVILEEMSMYRDTPEDSIQDEFDELLFQEHPLGKNILGTEETVNSFQQSDFETFLSQNLNTDKIILSSVGSYSGAKLQKLANKYLADIPAKNQPSSRKLFSEFVPQVKVVKKPITQAHVALGLPTYGLLDENRIPFFLLINILGGPSMNSKLNMALREKHGLVYGIDASYAPYYEVGQLGIYYATDPKNLKKCHRLIKKEFDLLMKKPMTHSQLHKAKQQLKGQLAMSEENNNSMMLMMAKTMLDLDKVPDIGELFDKIDNTTAEKLMELARENFVIENMSQLTYLPQ